MSQKKYFKNENRNQKEQVVKYTPNYQAMNIEPLEYKSGIISAGQAAPQVPQLRPKRPVVQPYAQPVKAKTNTIPNVGNNVEHIWSTVDHENFGDDFDPNQPIIDNNDYVNVPGFTHEDSSSGEVNENPDLLAITKELDTGTYLLLVRDVPICSGPEKEIQEQVQALVFGEHELCDGEPMDETDIMVLKKILIKVGVSLG